MFSCARCPRSALCHLCEDICGSETCVCFVGPAWSDELLWGAGSHHSVLQHTAPQRPHISQYLTQLWVSLDTTSKNWCSDKVLGEGQNRQAKVAPSDSNLIGSSPWAQPPTRLIGICIVCRPKSTGQCVYPSLGVSSW